MTKWSLITSSQTWHIVGFVKTKGNRNQTEHWIKSCTTMVRKSFATVILKPLKKKLIMELDNAQRRAAKITGKAEDLLFEGMGKGLQLCY